MVMDLVGVGRGRVLRVQPYYAQAHCFHGWLALPGSHTQLGNRSNVFVDWKTAKASFHTFEEVHIKQYWSFVGQGPFLQAGVCGSSTRAEPGPAWSLPAAKFERRAFISICWCLLRRVQSIFWLFILLQKWETNDLMLFYYVKFNAHISVNFLVCECNSVFEVMDYQHRW